MGKQRLRPNFPKGPGNRIIVPRSAQLTEEKLHGMALETIVVPMGWQLAFAHFEEQLRKGEPLPEGQELESFFVTCLEVAKTWSQVSLAWKEDQIKEQSGTTDLEEVPEKAGARKVIVE